MHLPHCCNCPRLALVLEPSAALNGDLILITSVNNTPQSHIKVFHNKRQRELLPLKDQQPGPSINESGPCLRDDA